MGTAEVLDNLLFSSTVGLFKAYGLQLTESQNRPREVATATMCAVIGFSGTTLSGALMIAADPEPIHKSRPTPEASDRDWIAELSNQLLGRFKNRLLGYGVEVYASTPVVLRGERITPLGLHGSLPGVIFDTSVGGRVTVWVDHVAVDGLKLDKALAGAEAPAREGDVVLF